VLPAGSDDGVATTASVDDESLEEPEDGAVVDELGPGPAPDEAEAIAGEEIEHAD
jgi:hypothetical protein